MHPMTHGTLAAAGKDAERLQKALARQDIDLAIELLDRIAKRIDNAITIELQAIELERTNR